MLNSKQYRKTIYTKTVQYVQCKCDSTPLNRQTHLLVLKETTEELMIFIRAQLFGYDGYPLFMNRTNIPIGLQSLFT